MPLIRRRKDEGKRFQVVNFQKLTPRASKDFKRKQVHEHEI